MKKFIRYLVGAGFAACLGLAAPAGAAPVVIRIAPPAPRREVIIGRPSPRHAWVPGYWRWSGRDYVWVGGAWQLPPRPRAAWVPGRYRRVRGGRIWIEGHWR
ncbi:MAG: YXWGXW repeat-containing protein [Thermoanaerobaculia bacterium]